MRRGAAALRREPAAVLRVLVREGRYGVTEVFATDDVGALRPLFTVAETYWDGGGGGAGRCGPWGVRWGTGVPGDRA
ncbi:hypothetical protein [Streptomyces sp. NBC_00078]|uniref:hypothetical protein n=1 Tax=unclassified Streptomyces TaxID=2593676 RepID=UPI00225543BC|nr:hypothetical protein [Streptomyces sp. NBC_00078]MCX5423243.1 hypothetical protein [Streptomyces sp. NBC_00078]